MNFATIGSGWIVDRFVAALKKCDGAQLAAVYSRSPEKAEAFAAKHGAPLRFTDISQLGACPDVDAVYIASPNALHAPQAIQLLEAGKHVLVEKPFASNSAQAQEVFDAAQRRGLIALEAMKPVFNPALDVIRALPERLGRPVLARLSFCRYSSVMDDWRAGKHVNTLDTAFSTGSIMDVGSYCAAVCARLFGEPRSISAKAGLISSGTDVWCDARADYGDFSVQLVSSMVTTTHLPCEIQYERGAVQFDSVSRISAPRIFDADGNMTALAEYDEDMCYELREFLRLVSGVGDVGQYSRNTLMELAITDELRRQCGVKFPADGR